MWCSLWAASVCSSSLFQGIHVGGSRCEIIYVPLHPHTHNSDVYLLCLSWKLRIHIYVDSCMHAWAQHPCIPASRCLGVLELLTFVSDEVSAQDDEQAQENEDDDGHHPSDHGVIHARGGRHGCGVLGKTAVDLGEEGEGGWRRRGGRRWRRFSTMNKWKGKAVKEERKECVERQRLIETKKDMKEEEEGEEEERKRGRG